MKGAEALIKTLVDSGVEVCFMNPGTSEMHFVAALDRVPGMRGVLALFEGVATGAADGYARMTGKPASTLLHLGPGLANGLANLHNARRGATPVVNIVGEHATYHKQYDAPLESDIEAIAGNVSGWIMCPRTPEQVGPDASAAVAASYGPPGQVATLVLPADVTWLEAGGPAPPAPHAAPTEVPIERVEDVAKVMAAGETSALLVGGSASRRDALLAAGRVAAASGAKLLAETFPSRLERGAGLPAVERLAYLAEFILAQLDGIRNLVVVDTRTPVAFFAYPDKPSLLVPEGCTVHLLAAPGEDATGALQALADVLGAPDEVATQPPSRPDRPTGEITAEAVANAIGALLPEGAIVSDEANTAGLWIPAATAGAPPHDWLCLTGGSIGQGMPVATGAAVACPDRPVVSLEADGSAMYTLQSLWTQAREGLDVTTVVFNNGSYAVLNLELARVGAEPPGPQAEAMLDISHPDLDFVSLAQGMGVEASRPETMDEFCDRFAAAVAGDGPNLIEVVLPAGF
ncbi:MAG: putative acetolactate synthase large subunit IlvX [Acidimicrobiales bacterium]|nr:MAG: acetolactate synthase large subunit [Actinomycetota bacterium]MBV6509800.1 putative acetolactate synthase large subunit IlvX [Acidimicrobiales bacterium]RIK04399.1 MAG: acetolactate synthase large subunit [Acidobacteriota bacterium]